MIAREMGNRSRPSSEEILCKNCSVGVAVISLQVGDCYMVELDVVELFVAAVGAH